MTEMTSGDALKRIKAAYPESPVLLTKSVRKGYVNAVFADTAHSQWLVRSNHPSVIGVYHKGSDYTRLKIELMKVEDEAKTEA